MTTKLEGTNSYQSIELADSSNNNTETISIEVIKGHAELMIETTDTHGDSNFAYTTLNRDQLWEHIHNCLHTLEGLK